MIKTYACTKKIKKIISFDKRTDLEKGISNFIEWFKNYYNLNTK